MGKKICAKKEVKIAPEPEEKEDISKLITRRKRAIQAGHELGVNEGATDDQVTAGRTPFLPGSCRVLDDRLVRHTAREKRATVARGVGRPGSKPSGQRHGRARHPYFSTVTTTLTVLLLLPSTLTLMTLLLLLSFSTLAASTVTGSGGSSMGASCGRALSNSSVGGWSPSSTSACA